MCENVKKMTMIRVHLTLFLFKILLMKVFYLTNIFIKITYQVLFYTKFVLNLFSQIIIKQILKDLKLHLGLFIVSIVVGAYNNK